MTPVNSMQVRARITILCSKRHQVILGWRSFLAILVHPSGIHTMQIGLSPFWPVHQVPHPLTPLEMHPIMAPLKIKHVSRQSVLSRNSSSGAHNSEVWLQLGIRHSEMLIQRPCVCYSTTGIHPHLQQCFSPVGQP